MKFASGAELFHEISREIIPREIIPASERWEQIYSLYFVTKINLFPLLNGRNKFIPITQRQE